jgi:trans-2-enoyl-CoA reductase
MPEYQIYSIGLDGYATTADNFECASDRDAIKKTLQVAGGDDTELWNETALSSGCFPRKTRHRPPQLAASYRLRFRLIVTSYPF